MRRTPGGAPRRRDWRQPPRRARLARLRADIAEKQYKRESGDLVDPTELNRRSREANAVAVRLIMNIPWVLASRLSFIGREEGVLIERELRRCLSNIGHGRSPAEDGADTDYDEIAEDAFIARRGRGVLTLDCERVASEALARRAATKA